MIVGRTFHIDAAHRLPNYSGKCANVHGHTWKITVEVEGEICPETGMVVDLHDLKEAVEEELRKLDHNDLNRYMEIPTCENMAERLLLRLSEEWAKDGHVYSVQVQEGEGGYARATSN